MRAFFIGIYMKLINKGGFRERANRSRSYKESENSTAQLQPNQYQKLEKQSNNQTPKHTK